MGLGDGKMFIFGWKAAKFVKLGNFQSFGDFRSPSNASKRLEIPFSFPERNVTETEPIQRKQAKMLAFFLGEWPEIDARNNETVSKLALSSRFSRRARNASKRLETPRNASKCLETPRNASKFFRNFPGFCVLRLFVSRNASEFHKLDFASFWGFCDYVWCGLGEGIWSFVVLAFTSSRHLLTIATTVAIVASFSLPISLPLSPSHPPLYHLMPFFPHLIPLSPLSGPLPHLMPFFLTVPLHCPSPSSSLCPYISHSLSVSIYICICSTISLSLSISISCSCSSSLSLSLLYLCFPHSSRKMTC